MKALSRPISSPGRTDKFPPPLMRFLRTNVASRSRGRASKTTTMFHFYLRSKKTSSTGVGGARTIEQEPTSPKVTCIGQVKIRRSNANNKKKKKKPTSKNRRKWWRCLKKPVFCRNFSKKSRASTTPLRCLMKWASCFRCKKVDSSEDSCNGKVENSGSLVLGGVNGEISRGNSSVSVGVNVNEGEVFGENCHKRDIGDTCSSSSPPPPPKNALLLTRCRSAPYRSSSLGGIFWGSPLKERGDDGAENELKLEEREAEVSRISEESVKELESVEELKGIGGGVLLHPLLLTRCKSEPARTGERLLVGTEAGFWKQRRFVGSVVESYSDHSS